jgi:NTP pyrophosphatase (non-canonical NTP hydrolase)
MSGKNFSEIEGLVLDWSRARGIIPNATPEAQFLKAVSEMGELADALNKGQRPEMIDAIGDVLVCLINLCELKGTSLTECLGEAWNQIKDRRGKLMPNGCFVKEEAR